MGACGGNGNAGRRKMSDVMALMAARPIKQTSCQERRPIAAPGIFLGQSLKKRRSNMSRASVDHCPAPPLKRPRTTWGKPHANLSSFRSPFDPIIIKQEPPSPPPATVPTTSNSSSPAAVLPQAGLERTDSFSSPSFQLKLEEELYYDDAPLHQVPTFFPMEHLLTVNLKCEPDFNLLGSESFDSHFGLVSPPASCSSSSSGSSSDALVDVKSPGGAQECHVTVKAEELDQACCLHDEVHGFLMSERFHEIARDMHSILGDLDGAGFRSSPTAALSGFQSLLFSKTDSDQSSDCFSQSDVALSDASSSSTAAADDEYRIDLTDFQPGPADHIHVEYSSEGEHSVKPPARHRSLSLSLNYEDVISAWCERGPLSADGGSWDTAALEACQLDLAAWEPENGMALNVEEVPAEASRMIMLAPADGVADNAANNGGCHVGAGGGSSPAGREARVLRYREKRRTRLFSKKIRYEVRKLNAERRPRMKGRFIKRT